MKLKEIFCNIFKLANIKGKNNKILFYENNKKCNKIFLPKGLTICIYGDNNICKISLPIKFKNTEITMSGDNNYFEIGSTTDTLKDATFKMLDGGIIQIGENCQFYSGNFLGICMNSYKNKHKIKIGNNVLFAQDVIVRCGDGHTILNTDTGIPTNEPKDIIIEDNVWVTSRCIVLKNSTIRSGSIVAENAVVNKQFTKKNVLLGGIPAKIIKENVSWDKCSFCDYMKKKENFGRLYVR